MENEIQNNESICPGPIGNIRIGGVDYEIQSIKGNGGSVTLDVIPASHIKIELPITEDAEFEIIQQKQLK